MKFLANLCKETIPFSCDILKDYLEITLLDCLFSERLGEVSCECLGKFPGELLSAFCW